MVDPITGAVASVGAKIASEKIAKGSGNFIAGIYSSITSKFIGTFDAHIASTLSRCSKMKNILYRDSAVDFLSQYVAVNFSTKSGNVSDRDALSKAMKGDRIVVSGTAGAGKTMFLRWSALDLIKRIKSHGRIPLYLEMRYFQTEDAGKPIEQYIYENTASKDGGANFEQFLEALKSGVFIIMLDAIDEINPSFRDSALKGLVEFIENFRNCGLIISSRPDEKLESIQDLSVLRTIPMDKNQIIRVIENLEYDVEVKSKLIVRLSDGLYEELEEFLSNPLLATIMLLSFDHSADIPTKLTSFYQQAFIALYQRHDAAKGAYKRNHYAGLPLDRFQDIFCTFSFQTYLNYKFEFSDDELLMYFSSACDYVGDEVSASLIIKDSMESVCLLQREGLDNVFAHRSFQEYFCALFVSKCRDIEAEEMISAIARMENNSNVLKMLFEISPEIFEHEWMIPRLKEFIGEIGRIKLSSKSGMRKFLKSFCLSLEIEQVNGKARSISLTHNAPSTICHVRWMSVIGSVCGAKYNFFDGIFRENLWDSMSSMCFIPENLRADFEYLKDRVHTIPSGEDDGAFSGYRIDFEDANWLIYTNLPSIFENLRTYAKRVLVELEARKLARVTKVRSLIEARPRIRRSNK